MRPHAIDREEPEVTHDEDARRRGTVASGSERLRRIGEMLRAGHGLRGKSGVLRALTKERWGNASERDVIAVPMAHLGGERIYVRPHTTDLANAASYFARGIHHPPAAAPQPRRIVELGTNMGAGLTALALEHREAQLVGVEPDGGNFAIAALNTARFGDRVRLIRSAIWDEDAELVVDSARAAGEHGLTIRSAGPGDQEDRRVSAITIDQLLERVFPGEQIDYMHVTIEGTEPRVFAAGGRWTERVRSLCVEAHPYLGYPIDACIAQLAELGYRTEAVPSPPDKWVHAWR